MSEQDKLSASLATGRGDAYFNMPFVPNYVNTDDMQVTEESMTPEEIAKYSEGYANTVDRSPFN